MATNKVHKTLFVLIYFLFGSAWTFEIELYSEKDRRGQSIKIDVSDNDCSELPLAWHSGVVSLDTLGNCVQLYDEPKCSGSLTVIQPFHIIHQMDLSLINYANRLRTVSPCGPKLKTGRYVIQNAADASVMAALNKHGNFAKAFTVNTTKSAAVPKSQQWEVFEKTNSEYSLRPRENSDNYPVSFDEESLKKGIIKRKQWRIMSVGRGRYIIKDPATQRCLYKTDDHNVEEHSCRIWSTNQEWVFRTIVGDPPADKPKAKIGQGYNFNIVSKVATLRPPTKPPPQYYPIHFNATQLAQIKKFSTAAPYQIKKKIKRGPRPKTKYFDEPSLDLKPPGLRPALPKNVANNNNYLLYKPANGVVAQDSYLPEFIPSDDSDLLPTKEMIKSTKQYQEYVEIVKQYLAEQHKKSMDEAHQKQKVHNEDEEETGAEEEEDETKEQISGDEEEVEDEETNSDESVSEATAESHQRATEKPKKRKEKESTSASTAKPTATDAAIPASDQPGFMSQVFTKFKSNFAAMVPTVQLGAISKVLPTLPSVPVPKLTLSFTKPNEKKSNDKLKKITHGSGNSESGFQFSYAGSGKNGEKQPTERSKFSFVHRPSRFFLRATSTTTKKPLTVGSWGIFG